VISRAAGPAAPARLVRDFLLLAAFAFPFVFALGMTRGLSHDEHQHVAAGALVAREALLPYRDFPCFHTPYLAFIYGALFQLTDHLLLAARLFSVGCATAAVALVGAVTRQFFRNHPARTARIATAGAVLLALTASAFTYTTGRAWNHEPALLAALLAFVVLGGGIRRVHGGWIFSAALLLGLCIGIRITYAPLIAPFGLGVLLFVKAGFARRVVLAGWFTAGLITGLAGVAWLAVIAPDQAWFANFEFAKVNITYRFSTGEPRTMTLPKKLRFLWKSVVRQDLGLIVPFLVVIVAAFRTRQAGRSALPLELVLVFLCLPFLLIGSFAPSPLFEQYFYPFVFFILIGAAAAFAAVPLDSVWFRRTAWIAALGVALSVVRGVGGYQDLPQLFRPSHWTPLEIHSEAAALRGLPINAPIVTLAPVHVLEAGHRIYPGFATGPFAWRIAPYLEPAKAARLKIPTPASLDALFAARPPGAFLLGDEKKGEALFDLYAQEHGYLLRLNRGRDRLWVRP